MMIPTTISGLLGLVIKVDIAITILYLIKLVLAKAISGTVNGLYDYGEKHPMVYKVIGGSFSVAFIATVILIGMSL